MICHHGPLRTVSAQSVASKTHGAWWRRRPIRAVRHCGTANAMCRSTWELRTCVCVSAERCSACLNNTTVDTSRRQYTYNGKPVRPIARATCMTRVLFAVALSKGTDWLSYRSARAASAGFTGHWRSQCLKLCEFLATVPDGGVCCCTQWHCFSINEALPFCIVVLAMHSFSMAHT